MVKNHCQAFWLAFYTSLMDFICKIQLFLVFSPIKELQTSTLVWQSIETIEISKVFLSFKFL